MSARAFEIAFGDRCISDALSAATRATALRDYMELLPPEERLTRSEDAIAREMCDMRGCAVAVGCMLEQSDRHEDECGLLGAWGRILGLAKRMEASRPVLESAERKCIMAANGFVDAYGIDALAGCFGCAESVVMIVQAKIRYRTSPKRSPDDADMERRMVDCIGGGKSWDVADPIPDFGGI